MNSLIGGLVGSLFFLGQLVVGETIQGIVDVQRLFQTGLPGYCAEVSQTMTLEECRRGCDNAGQPPCYIAECACGLDTPGMRH